MFVAAGYIACYMTKVRLSGPHFSCTPALSAHTMCVQVLHMPSFETKQPSPTPSLNQVVALALGCAGVMKGTMTAEQLTNL